MDLDLPFSGGRFAVHTLTDCQSVLLVLFTFDSNSQNPPPSQPSLQSTSCNKAQIRRLAMFALVLYISVFLRSIFILHSNVLEVNYGEQVSGWTVFSPKGRHTSLQTDDDNDDVDVVDDDNDVDDYLSAINCILWSQYPVRVKTKSQIKTSDYLNLYEIDFTLGPVQISRCIVF